MEAKYFYNRLLGYREESTRTGKYYYGYCNNMVRIHHKNDNLSWYVVHEDGKVYHRFNKSIGRIDQLLNIDDLEGKDFELFSPVQIIKSGYIILDTNSEFEVKKVITDLYKYISLLSDNEENAPSPCGGLCFTNGITSEFSYHSTNKIELQLQSIRELCKDNINRKYYDSSCIPFIKTMKNKNSIHVNFIRNMGIENNYEEIYKECDKALIDLLHYMKQINIKGKWINCKMRNPIYL